MFNTYQVASSLALLAVAHCHVEITYPGWRGNNLMTSGSIDSTNGLGVGISDSGSDLVYPYGMQWIYPCKLYYSSPTPKRYRLCGPETHYMSSRRWLAHQHEPHRMARLWRRRGPTAWLVRRAQERAALHQHRLRRRAVQLFCPPGA